MLSHKFIYIYINIYVTFSHHSFFLEINPNSRHESRVKSTIRILVKEARFPNAGVSKRQELHQIIIIHLGKEPRESSKEELDLMLLPMLSPIEMNYFVLSQSE